MSLILRILGAAGLAALVGVVVAAIALPMNQTDPAAEDARSASATAFAPLPSVNAQAQTAILEASPFARDRSPFDRAMASAPPPPPIEVKLTGVFRVGKELRASLTINGQSVVVRKGDATAAGKVAKIDGNAIVILSSGERRLEMYR
ncbi:MAG: hypothetical protein RIR33_1882 [Pseudomonadota bacterium]|jgi:hypothetical protein